MRRTPPQEANRSGKAATHIQSLDVGQQPSEYAARWAERELRRDAHHRQALDAFSTALLHAFSGSLEF